MAYALRSITVSIIVDSNKGEFPKKLTLGEFFDDESLEDFKERIIETFDELTGND